MITGIFAALSRGGAIIGAILLVTALLQQLIAMVGVLLGLVKFAIIIVFVAIMVMIVVAMWRSRKRDKAERRAS
jgi:TRAP-type C4-dicarboxylate transport system permease small subunit